MADMIATRLAPELREQPWDTPGDMATAFQRTTIQTTALRLIDEHLAKVEAGEIERLIISMPPQEGKSERTSRWFPLWCLHRNPNRRIAIVSHGHDIARRWGRKIGADLLANPQLGLTLSQSLQRQDEFELLGYTGGVVCVGMDG